MEFLDKHLPYIDFFGYNLSFRFNQYKKYRTYYGGLLTIICSGFLLFTFFNLAADCLNKTNPIVRESNDFEELSVVEGTKFFYSLDFTDENFNSIVEPEKYLIFHGVITNHTDHREIKTIPFIKCDFDRHFKKTNLPKEKIDEKINNLNRTWCLDLDNEFRLINTGNEIPRITLSIFVIECFNTTTLDFNRKLIQS